MRDSMLENRRIYESHYEAQLARWKSDLDLLKSKDGRVKFEAMAHHNDSIDALQQKYDETSHHLISLRSDCEKAWEKAKANTEEGWMAFKSAFQRPTERPIFATSLSKVQPGWPAFEPPSRKVT
jgi:hypothetical protein